MKGGSRILHDRGLVNLSSLRDLRLLNLVFFYWGRNSTIESVDLWKILVSTWVRFLIQKKQQQKNNQNKNKPFNDDDENMHQYK